MNATTIHAIIMVDVGPDGKMRYRPINIKDRLEKWKSGWPGARTLQWDEVAGGIAFNTLDATSRFITVRVVEL